MNYALCIMNCYSRLWTANYKLKIMNYALCIMNCYRGL